MAIGRACQRKDLDNRAFRNGHILGLTTADPLKIFSQFYALHNNSFWYVRLPDI
jgi:hypothetical protein